MEIYGSEEEKKLLNDINATEPWALVEVFSRIVRLSATPEERKAIDYLLSRMDALQIPYALYEPELYVSLPVSAELEILTESGERIRCKTPSFSASGTVEGEVVYLPSSLATQVDDFFNNPVEATGIDLKNKIVMTDGISLPKAAKGLEDSGAMAQIFINPHPVNMHDLIITSIWGIPTLDNIKDKPRTQVININRNTGDRIRHLLEKGAVWCRITTQLDEGWKKASIPVAEIKGTEEPEKFILLHGHLDSWHYGVTDNATGNAGKLEIARIFNRNKDKLKRSLRIAWWSGHSHGRYAGSTWYADFMGLDLEKNCIAQVNMDSPGVKWANRYDEMMWTAEVNDVCYAAISEASGIAPKRLRPMRAGDYSFNNIGITSFYMLSSNIPQDVKQEKGFYAVGGSGGNSDAWHNENDVIEFADVDILLRDIKIYAATLWRILTATVYPFDFVRAVDESAEIVTSYIDAAAGNFDLQPVLSKLANLRNDLTAFNLVAQKVSDTGDTEKAQAINEALLRLGRILISTSYAKKETFEHDPAVEVSPFPEIVPATEFSKYPPETNEYKFLQNQLLRGRNKMLHRLERAREIVAPFIV